MPKQRKSNQHLKPSDAYFKAIFKNKAVALQLIRYVMSDDMAEQINMDTLELAPESFIDEKLRESLSDLVYTCRLNTEQQIRVCLLFEHKSNKPGRELYPQLNRYMVGIQQEDIKQQRKDFTLTVPVLFYNGKDKWTAKPASAFYGDLPEGFSSFVPTFRFLVVNLQEMSDAEILAMRDTMLLRNIFLAMKHAWEDDFYRHHYEEVFIFVHPDLSDEMLLSLFSLTFQYIYQVSLFKEKELMGIIDQLPPKHKQLAKSTWGMMVEKYSTIGLEQGRAEGLAMGIQEGLMSGMQKGLELGMEMGQEKGLEQGLEKGLEQGLEQGLDRAVENVLNKRPDLPDAEVAELLSVTVERVQRIRAILQGSKSN